ncbi:MAG: uracil-DNA glycosylase family protein [Candidatus Kapaibacteriota bacterium]
MSVPRQRASTEPEFGSRAAAFLTSLRFDVPLPRGFTVLDPYRDQAVVDVVQQFCARYYAGNHARVPIWGINPGRFGAGITGLSFTDPYALQHDLGLITSIAGRREPSAEYVYRVISAYGGPKTFYHDVYMSALSPLGFIKNGVNINFYDDPALTRNIVPFVVECMRTQMSMGLRDDVCVVLGSGKLKAFMEKYIRPEISYSTVHYLEHPRYIMQYRRSQMGAYVQRYVDTLLHCTR